MARPDPARAATLVVLFDGYQLSKLSPDRSKLSRIDLISRISTPGPIWIVQPGTLTLATRIGFGFTPSPPRREFTDGPIGGQLRRPILASRSSLAYFQKVIVHHGLHAF
jgi:hypothetical protein